MRVTVLGGGVVGQAVAWDLSRVAPVAAVTIADRDAARLEDLERRLGVETRQVDLSDPSRIDALLAQADVTVGALPSPLALPVIALMARRGRRHVDVSFLAEDPRAADPVAHTSGAVIVYDCGVAPGLSHVLVGDAVRALARTAFVRIDVGGLPVAPEPPFFYKAPFAPADVIEEYTRPARLVRDGRHVALPALSEPDVVDVDGVGTLEAFNTDGLRSLVDTIAADAMVERTLRYRGHREVMQVLADAGLLDATPVDVRGVPVSPRDLTSAVLFPRWRYEPGERDLTVLRVEVEGTTPRGEALSRTWQLVDRQPEGAPLSSMARTTGWPAAIVARWLAEGRVTTPGVHPPETLGLDGLADAMLDALAARGLMVVRTR